MAPKALNRYQKAYLAFYNILVFGFHLIALVDLLFERFKKDTFNYSNHYQFFVICTLLQLGDVIHALIGLTTTNVPVALVQIFGRLLVLFIAKQSYVVWQLPSTFILLLVYVAIEIIRYPYYFFKTIDYDSIVFTFLRYNAWLILYPIGFACEAFTIYQVAGRLHHNEAYLIRRPFGASFNVDLALVAAGALFLLFPFIVRGLLSHMWQQRTVQNRALWRKIQ